MVQPVHPNNTPKNVTPTPPVPVDHPAPKTQNSAFDHVVDQVKAAPAQAASVQTAPVQAARVQTPAAKAPVTEAAPAPPQADVPHMRVDAQV